MLRDIGFNFNGGKKYAPRKKKAKLNESKDEEHKEEVVQVDDDFDMQFDDTNDVQFEAGGEESDGEEVSSLLQSLEQEAIDIDTMDMTQTQESNYWEAYSNAMDLFTQRYGRPPESRSEHPALYDWLQLQKERQAQIASWCNSC